MTERVTYPETLLPSRLAAGETYASASDILACEDLTQSTVHVPHWRVHGQAVALLVRAPSLSDMEQINRAGSGPEQYIVTMRLCCVTPAFNSEQAERLREKNPNAVEQIALYIWSLARLNHEWIERVVQTQTGAAPAPSADTEGGA